MPLSGALHALLGRLHENGQASEVAPPGEGLVVPLEVLHQVRPIGRGAALSGPTPYPLVPLSSADLLVNARGVPLCRQQLDASASERGMLGTGSVNLQLAAKTFTFARRHRRIGPLAVRSTGRRPRTRGGPRRW